MTIKTGQTVYENVASFDILNNPVSAATFDSQIFKNGLPFPGITINESLSDGSKAIFTFSWSASSIGDYQLYVKNETTSVVYMSEVYKAVPDEEFDFNVYVGI